MYLLWDNEYLIFIVLKLNVCKIVLHKHVKQILCIFWINSRMTTYILKASVVFSTTFFCLQFKAKLYLFTSLQVYFTYTRSDRLNFCVSSAGLPV